MDDVRYGRRARALRHRRGLRQRDVGERAGVSQDLVSLIEVGRLEDVSVRSLRQVAAVLGGELRIELGFRGAELDRLLDEGHAALVGEVATRLEAFGWETRPEVSFAGALRGWLRAPDVAVSGLAFVPPTIHGRAACRAVSRRRVRVRAHRPPAACP